MNVAVSFAWRRVWRISRPRYRLETTPTTSSTRNAVDSVNLVVRLRRIVPPRLVFFQLVVKRLQADAEKLRRARFVLAGGFESLHDQFALGVVHGGADGKTNPAQAFAGHH